MKRAGIAAIVCGAIALCAYVVAHGAVDLDVTMEIVDGSASWAVSADGLDVPYCDPCTSNAGTSEGPTFARGDSATVLFHVTNQGDQPVMAPAVRVSWRRYDAGSECGIVVRTLPDLEPGETASDQVTIDTIDLAAGCYVFSVWVDPENAVVETDESNNRQSACGMIAASLPNLHITGLVLSPTSPVEQGQVITATVDVVNRGEADAGPYELTLSVVSVDGVQTQDWEKLGVARSEGLSRDGDERISISFSTFPTESLSETSEEGSSESMSDVFSFEPDKVYLVQAEVSLESVAIEGEVSPVQPEEETEEDNAATTSFLLTANPRSYPDLKPVSLVLDPSSPLAWGEPFRAVVEVVNIGGAPAVPDEDSEDENEVSFHYRSQGTSEWHLLVPSDTIKIDRIGIETNSVDDNRETRDLLIIYDSESSFPAIPGEYELKVVVDAKDAVTEQNETNNSLTIGFTIEGAELHPIGLDVSSNDIQQGDSVTVAVDVTNTGERAVGAFTVGYFVDGVRLDTFYFGSTSEQRFVTGDTTTTRGYIDTTDLSVGEHVLRVVVDADNQIPEVDESNNEISTRFAIGAHTQRKAELRVEKILVGTDDVGLQIGSTLVRATIANHGTITAEHVRVDLGIGDAAPSVFAALGAGASGWTSATSIDPVWIDRLEPGEKAVASWLLAFETSGARAIAVVADAYDEIDETDDTNNALVIHWAGLTVVDRETNLTCGGLAAAPSDLVDAGTDVMVSGLISNTGQQAAGSFSVEWVWYDSMGGSYVFDTQEFGGLGPGRSESVLSATVDTSQFVAGVHSVLLRVDRNGEVEESNEEDNECVKTIQIGGSIVPGEVDLVPVSVRFGSPSGAVGEGNTVEQDQTLYAYVTVRNNGTVPSGSFAVQFQTAVGTGTETWTSVGPQDQAEVSYPVITSTAGTFDLVICVDPDNLISESDETNNELSAAGYTVAEYEPPCPRRVTSGTGNARWLGVDSASNTVYVLWSSGEAQSVRNVDGAGSVNALPDIGHTVAAVAWDLTTTAKRAYVGAADGTVLVVDLTSTETTVEFSLSDAVVAIVPGAGATVYATTAGRVYGLAYGDGAFTQAAVADVASTAFDLAYDEDRAMLYVATTSGVYAYDADLNPLCSFSASEIIGTPTAFALGGSGVYVGTSAGIVYALSHCTTYATTTLILEAWRYPRSGTLDGEITSVVIDPRDIDPIYIATSAGRLGSLDFDGEQNWPFETKAGIHSIPLADERSGRLLFGDDSGTPYVLTLDGEEIEIDRSCDYAAGQIESNFVIVETRIRTDSGTRFVRSIYYGTVDGDLYTILLQR